jgi:hypothetical protein
VNQLRAATTAEIESIRDKSDLDPTCQVVALDTPKGAIIGVIRRPVELDPVHFPEGVDDRHKTVFARDVANGLLFMGVTHFYFNVPADDAKWLAVIQNWGAESVSPAPELRFKKVLYVIEDKNEADSRLQQTGA